MTAPPVDTPQAWEQLASELPGLLEQLLDSTVYGFEQRPRSDQRGIYLFSEGEQHFYVGRTSVTARSRRAGNTDGRSFGGRYGEHVRDSSPPGSAAFAARMAAKVARDGGLRDLPPDKQWWEARKKDLDGRTQAEQVMLDAFAAAKVRIRGMQVRVLPLDDDGRGVRSTLVELYVHAQFGTPYNDFSTS
jgi:hypothetical protein